MTQVTCLRQPLATSGSPRLRTSGPAATTRMFALHAQLAAGAPIDAVRLARVLEVSTRTVKRDIECLRDSHAAPIAWDAAARTYRYTAPFDLLTGLRLDADETLALVLAGRTFAAWGNTPLGRTLTLALQKIARLDRSTTPAMVLVIELL